MASKRILPLILTIALALLVYTCGGNRNPPTPSSPTPTVTSVRVTGTSSLTAIGQTSQLTATAIWSDGTSRVVTTEATWQSSNTTVLAVSASGLVTANGLGEADVRASYADMTGLLRVTVRPIEPTPPPMGLTCGVERWAVKTLSDADALRVDLYQVTSTTIRVLNDLPPRCSGLPVRRTYEEEFRVYEVLGRVTLVRREDDRDYHVVLADPIDTTQTIVVEVADPECNGPLQSPYRTVLIEARQMLDVLGRGALVGQTVRLRGVGFYDFDHRQTGRSRSCLELHPVLAIDNMTR